MPSSTTTRTPETPCTALEDRDPKSRKHVTKTACVFCRRKRTKCDGQTPCQQCRRRESPCMYKTNEVQSKHDLLREVRSLRKALEDCNVVVEGLRDPELSGSIVEGVRNGRSPEQIANVLRGSAEHCSTSSTSSNNGGGGGTNGQDLECAYPEPWQAQEPGAAEIPATGGGLLSLYPWWPRGYEEVPLSVLLDPMLSVEGTCCGVGGGVTDCLPVQSGYFV